MDQFQDRVCGVTGAASGIGFGLAERLAQAGMKVVLAVFERQLYVLPMQPAFKERFLEVIRPRAAAITGDPEPAS